jgi:hypothetical protein
MAKAPTELFRHIPRFPASLVFALSFGRELEEHDLAEVQKILADFVFDINPGRTSSILSRCWTSFHFLSPYVCPFLCSTLHFILHTRLRAEGRRKRVQELAVNMVLSSHSSRTHAYFCH